jgi:hypothetical protein
MMAHWTQDPKNKEKLAKAAAKRARTKKKRGRRSSAKSSAAVRYGAKSDVIGMIRAELKDAKTRVTELTAILRRYTKL